ncbi:MAG: hypothetical protein Q9218_007598 [Villophora microphyllina]
MFGHSEMAHILQFRYFIALIQSLLFHGTLGNPIDPATHLTMPNKPPWNDCVRLGTWQQSLIKYNDCLLALELFRQAEAQKVGSQRFEFHVPNARLRSGLLPQVTPRGYTSRTCTIIVAMLSTIPRTMLPPGIVRKPYPQSDAATYDELRGAAREIVQDCVKGGIPRPLAGWQTKGHWDGAIGVWVWQTGSDMDRMIRQVIPSMLSLEANETSLA